MPPNSVEIVTPEKEVNEKSENGKEKCQNYFKI